MPTKCAGIDGLACAFGLHGGALQTGGGYTRCVWCSADRMAKAVDTKPGRANLSKALKAMGAEQQQRALRRVPAGFRAAFEAMVARADYCPGVVGEACVFAEADAGRPVQLKGKQARCTFCDAEALTAACATAAGRDKLLPWLRRMAAASREKAVEERLGEEHRAYFRLALAGAPGRGLQRASRKRPAAAADTWAHVVGKRSSHTAPASASAKKKYRQEVLDDRARARRHFGLAGRAVRGEEVSNDTGLPPPKRSKLALDIYNWCCNTLWGMCRVCSSMVPMPLTPSRMSNSRPSPWATLSECSRCQAKVRCNAPVPEDVPEALRGLAPDSIQALALLEIDVGPEIRAAHNSGYRRQHATMARFFWHSRSSKDRIKDLVDEEQRTKALAARRFLLDADGCSYRKFETEHKKFLGKHPTADACSRRRRLAYIETPGLETAVWPHLFYQDSLCLTVVRSTDARRLGRAAGPTMEDFVHGNVASENEDAEEAGDDGQRHSIKRAYAALALSARIGYGSSYDVLHFAYDLFLWSALGAKKRTSLDYDIPMRVLMKGHSFSPLYWKAVHWGLIDLVRQLDYPKLFWTLSPYEWSFPYPPWILDEMSKELRGRLHLAVPESLHITHVLLQVVRGALAGQTGNKSKDPWRSHLLHALDSDGRPQSVHVFLRIEFQDGTRKAPTQDYHGSGRPHVHVLVFAPKEALRSMKLEESVFATLPEPLDENDPLPGIVEGSQLDRAGRSGWPLHMESSQWDSATDTLLLHRNRDNKAKGLRPYFLPVMEALRCHQDLQVSDDDGVLRSYVAKYVSKFSDSSQDEWLNDSAQGNAIAATVLCRYRPCEPELASGNGLSAPRAAGHISLLDFLRKTNRSGQIAAWLKKLHAASGSAETLESFATHFMVHGQQIVAADTLSKFNDNFFGQWLLLHVPFRRVEDFYEPIADKLALIPREHHNFAMAVLCEHPVAREMWSDPERFEAELRLEATTKSFMKTLLGMVAAHRTLVHKYLSGAADAAAEEAGREANQPAAVAAGPADHRFNRQQRHLQGRVDEAVDRYMAAKAAEHEEAAEPWVEDAYRNGKIFACTGGPGTGKTTVALACLQRVLELGARARG
ncbi:unnamed protein product [Durusdinium trenchii]|uniref:Uncharacterized protein n=1 Tax=Durusdinium trenchii TaxID=1381693 RepID=A0ABP0MKR5_9DINO